MLAAVRLLRGRVTSVMGGGSCACHPTAKPLPRQKVQGPSSHGCSMRGIGNILVGIVFIIGGATGKLALIGTNSSVAIMILGVALVAWGGWQAFQGMKQEK
jgi:hypothetical protein